MKYIGPEGKPAGSPWRDGDPNNDVEGDVVTAKVWEHPMREIVTVITGAGLTPSGDDLGQLRKAIDKRIADNVPEIPDLEPIRAKLEKTQTGLKEYRVLDGNYQLVSTDAGAMLGMAGDIQIGLQGTGQYVQASVYTVYNPFNSSRLISYVDGVSIIMAGHGPLTTCRIKPYGLVTLMYLGYNKWLCTGAGVES